MKRRKKSLNMIKKKTTLKNSNEKLEIEDMQKA
jgi:hypothetical protein